MLYFGLAVAFLLVAPNAYGQKKKPKKTDKEQVEVKTEEKTDSTKAAPAKEKKDDTKYIKDLVKATKAYEGLFTFYQDTTSGKLYMEIKKDQIDKEFIHFAYMENGVLDAGVFKGAYRGSKIFRIKKYFNRIEFVEENTSYYFDPENPLSRAADANIAHAILASEAIKATDQKEAMSYLIEADDLFLSEALAQIKFVSPPGASSNRNPFKLGNLSKTKNKYDKIKSYPENVDLVVDLVYDNPAPTNYGSGAVADARSITLKVQHSLIAVPENDYQPRYDDPRVGYFMTQVDDQTSHSATPYRDMIHRWHLAKKDPGAELSEPVEPIVWWIENTTPEELRPYIKQGVESWNIAFEKAGFKNAVVVKVQPDDAEWDAGDIRYNVLRWTSSPQPPFGGYGPSFVNPRTGQILGADIMLEYVFVTNRVKYDEIFDGHNQSLEEMMFGRLEQENTSAWNPYHCEASQYMHQQVMMGRTALRAMNAPAEEESRMIREAVIELSLHEVGHTLGLNHNFRSSQFLTFEQMHDRNLTSKRGLTGSVMEYAPINVNSDLSKQGEYYTTCPGPYDLWAIEFGYRPDLTEEKMEALLAKSTAKELSFGNDADNIYSPGRGIDPTMMTYDMSSDAIDYAIDRIKLVSGLLPKLLDKYTKEGKSYQELVQAYSILMGQYGQSATVISRYIGGVRVDRAMAGQEGATQPFTPISEAEQKRAMQALAKYAFAPDAFLAPDEIYNYLMSQRRGQSGSPDPKVHNMINAYQKNALAHLMHPTVLKRMTDAGLYGNDYSVAEMMSDLTDGVFNADLKGSVNTSRQNLQNTYADGLISALSGSSYDHTAKAAAFYELNRIKRMLNTSVGDKSTKAHRSLLIFKIDQAMDTSK